MRQQFRVIYVLGLSILAVAAAASGSPSSQGSCSSIFAGLEPVQRTVCFDGGYCSTAQDCLDACPSAAGASCIEEQCRYTSGSGGGNPGGGNPYYCFPTSCQSSQQCSCLRPDGLYDYGQCIQGACQY